MKTYFTGDFSARRPITVISSVLFTTAGVLLAVKWMTTVGVHLDSERIIEGLGFLIITLFILILGLFLLTKVLVNAKTLLVISSEGISYGTKNYRWEDVSEVGVMTKYVGRSDLYCSTKSAGHVIELLLSDGLTAEETETLFGSLRRHVKPVYPEIGLIDGNA